MLCVRTPAMAQIRADVPPGCGSEAELQGELERLLGDAAIRAQPLSLQIRATEDAAAEYTLELTVQGERRTLRDRDCRALFKAALVVAASAVQPDPSAPARIPEARAASAPAERARTATRQANQHAAPAHWHADVSLAAGATLGLLPSLAPRFELGAGLQRGRLGALIALHYTMPQQQRAAEGRGVRVWAAGGEFAAVFVPFAWLRLAAGLDVAWLNGTGLGSSATTSDSAWMIAPMFEVALAPLHTGPLRLELAVDAKYAALRPSFEITGYGEVFRVPRAGGSALARAAWQFH
jgi:hypothetical protein